MSSKTPKPRVELTMAAAKRIGMALYEISTSNERDRARTILDRAIRAAKGACRKQNGHCNTKGNT